MRTTAHGRGLRQPLPLDRLGQERALNLAARVLLVAAALAPATWFRTGLAAKGVDSYFSLHPEGRLAASLFAWDARMSPGEPHADLITIVLNAVQAGLGSIAIPVPAIEALVLTMLAAAAATGMYVLVLRLGGRTPFREVAAAATALAWIANPFSLAFVWWHQFLIEWTWAVLPWLLVLLVDVTRGDGRLSRRLALVVLVTIVGAPAFPHTYLPAIVLLMVAVAVGLALTQDRPRSAFFRALAFGAAFAAGLLWWLVPTLPLLSSLADAASIGPSSRAQFEYASQFSSLGHVLSLTALPQLYTGVYATRYVSWASIVSDPLGRVALSVLPVVALIGVVVHLRPRGRALPGALLVVLAAAAFVSKGLNPPLRSVNQWLFDLPAGEALRHPVDKFSFALVVPLCVLFAWGLETLLADRYLRPLGAAAVVVVAGIVAVPWWTGTVIPSGGGVLPSAWVDMPRAYDRVGARLAKAEAAGKTEVLPYVDDGSGTAFAWKSGIQPNLDPILEDWAPDRTILSQARGDAYGDQVGRTLAHAAARRDGRAFALARLWGVDAWLVHRDWASRYLPPRPSPIVASRFLARATGRYAPRRTFAGPALEMWRQQALPVVFLARSIRRVEPQPAAYLAAAASLAAAPAPAFVDPDARVPALDPRAGASWHRDSPVAFHGTAEVQGSTVLVFLQTYAPGWHLSVDGAGARVRSHLLASGFANGWIVDGRGRLRWRLTYAPQLTYDAGLVAGGVLFLAALAVLIGTVVRRPSPLQRAISHEHPR